MTTTTGSRRHSLALVDNTATFTTTNDGTDEASDSTEVLCSDVTITKTADNAKVNAGEDIGFTVTVTNGGTGLAKGGQIDGLPPVVGTGVDWVLDVAGSDATCAITGTPGPRP